MSKPGPWPRVKWSLLLLVLAACATSPSSRAPAGPGDPRDGLTAAQLDRFHRGKAVFERVFTPATGLGPLWNNVSCVACHDRPAAGGSGFESDDIEIHASRFDSTAKPACNELTADGGPVFHMNATSGTPPRIPPSANLGVGQRTTSPLFGLGLIDLVPDAAILARQGTLGGRAHRLPDGRIGRFGRKASNATLQEFSLEAFVMEMGIEIPTELSAEDGQLTVDFVRFLAIPRRREDSAGAKLFAQVGCDGCHVPRLADQPLYTDLLLHDLGPSFQDMCRGQARPTEFRTAPLIGVRFLQRFLHDGRAASVGEAIRLHGGQAEDVVRRFERLSPDERQRVIHFVEGL
jgi:CxxC motif-containing protein (DUF1111 family)